jgi:formate dehydrogenase major subunit
MGHPWVDKSAEQVFAEVQELAPNFRGITYTRLAAAQGLQWPVPNDTHPGTPVLHTRLWEDTVDPRVAFMPVDYSPPVEPPTPAYPLTLTTGRRLAFYNTGVQSNVYPHPHHQGEQVEVAVVDAGRMGLTEGMRVRVTSRRGSIIGPVHISPSLPPGVVFLSFHFPDQVRTNVLTLDATDPRSGTAEFKAAAVRVEKWPSQEA